MLSFWTGGYSEEPGVPSVETVSVSGKNGNFLAACVKQSLFSQ